ncbi:MAG: nucleotide exchange factor GrpE [Clostridiaceae bacterium]|jgi:molecular chaperone GrpE|nr:nucleotide exchange factor GrpE [Clostridiaceae bacterium]
MRNRKEKDQKKKARSQDSLNDDIHGNASSEQEKIQKEEDLKADRDNSKKFTDKVNDEAEDVETSDDTDSEEEVSFEEKLAALNNRYLRVCADFDNYRRRSAKEKESIYDDGIMDVLRELMPVVDSMDAAVKAAEKWDDAEHGKDFAEGMSLIMDQWTKALEKLGVEEIPGEGSTFDPGLHQVVAHVEDDAYDDNTVVEVYRKGYVKGLRVIRHSMVKVAN